jgi:hypothetical protein
MPTGTSLVMKRASSDESRIHDRCAITSAIFGAIAIMSPTAYDRGTVVVMRFSSRALRIDLRCSSTSAAEGFVPDMRSIATRIASGCDDSPIAITSVMAWAADSSRS